MTTTEMNLSMYYFFPFTEDHAIGLSTFTIMAGLGGSLGYAMGAFNWGSLGKQSMFYVLTSKTTLKLSILSLFKLIFSEVMSDWCSHWFLESS